jgi:hypothetical protein
MLRTGLKALTMTGVLSLAGAAAPAAEVLTDSQLDSVTAGSVWVGVDALAAAEGSLALTYTETSTLAFRPGKGVVSIGRGSGTAYACCGTETYAAVHTAGGGDGDILIVRSQSVQISRPNDSLAKGRIIVVSVDPPGR